jgi:phospholipid-binding lipoprotein MlaA
MSRNRSWQGHPATLAATLLLHAAKEKGGVGTTSRVGKARAHRRGRIVLANPPSHRRNSPNANETRQRAFPIGVPGTRLRQVRPTVLGTLPLSRLCLSVIAAIAMARKPRAVLRAGALIGLLGVAACGPAALPPGDSIEDASEFQNRAVHRFNLSLDRALVGPAANTYGTAIPAPVRQGVTNFASNLNQPGYVLNDLLQLRVGDAVQNTLRFAINSTVGIGGLLDPASAVGLPAAETDFGETMHVYGLGEGDYHVLPVFGPSTTRDSVGLIVDFAMNPLRHVVEPPETGYLTGARVLAQFGNRNDFASTIDDVLYRSEDSYTALRSLYLQNRRFELRGGSGDLLDPYSDETPTSDPASDAYFDPYADPYFDPYSQ